MKGTSGSIDITPQRTVALHPLCGNPEDRFPGSLEIAFAAKTGQFQGVKKLCIFVGTTVGSFAGFLCTGFMAQFIVGGIGSLVGVYLGWKLAQRIERGY